MTPKETALILRLHNAWRRGDDETSPNMTNPALLGEAIDSAVKFLDQQSDLAEQVECSTITRDNMEGRLNILIVKFAAMKQERDDLQSELERERMRIRSAIAQAKGGA